MREWQPAAKKAVTQSGMQNTLKISCSRTRRKQTHDKHQHNNNTNN